MSMSRKEIWDWYLILEDWRQSGLTRSEYCIRNNIVYVKFQSVSRCIYYKKYTNPEEYHQAVQRTKEYRRSGLSRPEFCRKHNFNSKALAQTQTHLNYLEVIEGMKNNQAPPKENKMQFISVPKSSVPVTHHSMDVTEEYQEQEFIAEKNSIELTISKGVKVIVEPKLAPEKLIKIIEFLKDL